MNYTPKAVGTYSMFVSFADDDEYNNTNSSKDFLVSDKPGPIPPEPTPSPIPSPIPSLSDIVFSNGLFDGFSLSVAGFPLFVLVILTILGLFYWKRK
ncbi:MAG: hypothetical protein LBB45_00335 [Methanobrevibacter sp.]|nr:hypothetical protein [Candidatus Methanovirga basalitermitum]